jgi:hypothetical protein
MKSAFFAVFTWILSLSQVSLADATFAEQGLSKYGSALLENCGGLYRSFNLYQTLYSAGTDVTAQQAQDDNQSKNLQDKSELLLILINLEGMPGYRPVENKMKCLESLKELNQNISQERSKQMGFSENHPDQVTIRASQIIELAQQKLKERTNK